MHYDINISKDEDGMFVAECPSITGCICKGRTEHEAEKNVLEVIKECLEGRAQGGCC